VTVKDAAAPTRQVPPNGLGVTAYDVMAEPPSSVGASHMRVAVPLPTASATAFVGTLGTVVGVTDDDAVDGEEVATAVVAVTANV